VEGVATSAVEEVTSCRAATHAYGRSPARARTAATLPVGKEEPRPPGKQEEPPLTAMREIWMGKK
jgi:hypothetical protein